MPITMMTGSTNGSTALPLARSISAVEARGTVATRRRRDKA
jgi:hypothetical protein